MKTYVCLDLDPPIPSLSVCVYVSACVHVCVCVSGCRGVIGTYLKQPRDRQIMAMNPMCFKSPSAGLKATNMIVLVHKLTRRVLTSSMCVCALCVRARVRACVCVRGRIIHLRPCSPSESGHRLKFLKCPGRLVYSADGLSVCPSFHLSLSLSLLSRCSLFSLRLH